MSRRTREDIRQEADDIEALLRRRGSLRAEEIADEMKVVSRYLEKPLKLLKTESRVVTAGEKRWTQYAASSRSRS